MLLARAREHREGKIDEEDVYVWWGKVKSSNRQQPLPHLARDPIDGCGPVVRRTARRARSTSISPTIGRCTSDMWQRSRPRTCWPTTTRAITFPKYYRDRRLTCDCWFRLFDIRRVIADDTVAVVEELKKLRNTRYNDRPVSIYGGMVELPLVVTRDDGARYFEADVRAKLIDGRFWVEFDAERTGVGEMGRELRDNVVGEASWNALDPAVRTFVATAESLFRAHRKDPAFDFSAVVVDFAKAIELQANLLLRRGLAGLSEADRRANVDGRSVDLASGELWPLGTLGARDRGDGAHQSGAQAAAREWRVVHGELAAGAQAVVGAAESGGAQRSHHERRRATVARSRLGCGGARNSRGVGTGTPVVRLRKPQS